ncbi:MAG TPA: ScyD/ScyE family protein [Blastocatellia bacterium]|nr:ScyD/ScyE family protein [Blastocatellia bacterium]
MTRLNLLRLAAPLALAALFGNLNVNAQPASVLATGLQNPAKITMTDAGNLLVAEAGTGRNTGRISLVNRCGTRRTLLDGLPAGIAPEGANSGPSGIERRGNILFISIGAGDEVVAGPLPGTTVPNPNGPASPILSSVLQVDFEAEIDRLASGFSLSPAGHAALTTAPLTLTNAQGIRATVRLLADFPDFVNDQFAIARPSNPYALALGGDNLFVADASFNLIAKINLTTGAVSTLTGFAPGLNPLPFGPPIFEAVPDGIRFFNNQLLVTLLTGFPFPAGKAEVRRAGTEPGGSSTFIGGLTTAIDVVPVKTRAGGEQFYVLEFSTNFLAQPQAPGRLLRFDSPTGSPQIVATGLISPSGMTRDPKSGDIFITEVFTGRIMRVAGDELDVSLKDDATGDTLRFNSITGDYVFLSCRLGGLTLRGQGRIRHGEGVLELRSAQVEATIDGHPFAAPNQGRAKIRLTPLGPTILINDRSTAGEPGIGQ